MITTDQAGTEAGFDLFFESPLSTADPRNADGDYITGFGGTSSAAPAVAGALAVLLGVNPGLTWRDVKHILALTSRKIDAGRREVRAAFNGSPYVAQHAWQTNAAGYEFHNWYGFGAVDVDAAVAMASAYTPDGLGPFVESDWFEPGQDAASPLAVPDAGGAGVSAAMRVAGLPDADGTGVSATLQVSGLPDADGAGASAAMQVSGLPEGADIEAVVLEISVEHGNAFDLGVTLRSPAGTPSVVNPPFNAVLHGFPGLHQWQLLSNAFYGENPNGAWTLHVADLAAEDTGRLVGWRLRFYYGEHAD